MKYNFETYVNRTDQSSSKWKRAVGDLPPFSVADTDFEYPPQLVSAFTEYTSSMIFGYTRPTDEYYASFIKWMSKRHNFEVERDWILDGNGVVNGINTAIRAFTNEGDNVMIMSPVYGPFKSSIEATKRTVVDVPLVYSQNTYTIDYQLLEESAKDSKLLIMCSPHNPVGRVWTNDELKLVAEICERHNVKIISDEIHMDIIMPGHKHIVFSSISDYVLNNSVLLTSASKSFNIAGAQTSMAIIKNESMRNEYKDIQTTMAFHGVNAFGFKLSEIAYTQLEDWFDELLQVIETNRKYLFDYMTNFLSDIFVIPLEGTYLQWIDFSSLGLDDEALNTLLIESGLVLGKGIDFGEEGSQFMRFNLAIPTSVLIKALEKLHATLIDL